MPRRALKAGSTDPPLAVRTALMIAASIDGKASFRVISACSWGGRGLGGFTGGTSTIVLGLDVAGSSSSKLLWAPWSCASSSKSNGRAVVGDSGGIVEDCLIVEDCCGQLCGV